MVSNDDFIYSLRPFLLQTDAPFTVQMHGIQSMHTHIHRDTHTHLSKYMLMDA